MSSTLSEFLPVRVNYLQETLLELFFNGLYTGLFFLTLYATIFKRKLYKTNIGLFLALILMYMLSTVHAASRWILVKNAFIDNADSPESTLVYLLQSPLWLTVLAAVVFTANTIVSDFVLIWRCWTVWNRNWNIVALPIVCTLVGAGLGFRSIAEQAAYVLNPNLDRTSFVDFATPYFGLSLATTCLTTGLIIVRIFTMTEGTANFYKDYGRVIEIVVESAVLYSVTLIVFLPFLVRGSYDDGYVQAIVAQMTGMAPTLIVARVSFGLARPDETWNNPTSSLFFGRVSKPGLPTSSTVLSNDDTTSSGQDAVLEIKAD
ncbi:hypothetical protein C8R46DRAFT_1214608 [Mycena filopes]|nr:hypothetical protein C8R46DRAFT_1214608 [Mycena filopes]